MKQNKIKEKLKRGKAVMVPEINRIFSPKIVELLGLLKYECVWIDMEHSDLSYGRLSEMILAARVTDMDVIVRIAKGGYNSIIRTLEVGASGLVLPHCMSADEAKEFVRMAKFAPLGLRGIGAGRDSNYGLTTLNDYLKKANKETLLIVQIEDKEAVDEVDAIASVKGIDVLFIGPVDLSQSFGVVGKLDHHLMQQAIKRVSTACRKHGKGWGLPVKPGRDMQEMLKKGARFFNCATETGMILQGFQKVREDCKKYFSSKG